MTFTNRYFQEGVEQGLEQGLERGLEQGLERGLEQGSRNLLSALLEQRFGALDPATRDRLANADRARLDRWAGRLLAAASLAEVFDD